jgi:hypothetical protein
VPNGTPAQLPVGALATHLNTTPNDPGFPDAIVAAQANEGIVLLTVLTGPSELPGMNHGWRDPTRVYGEAPHRTPPHPLTAPSL